MAERMPLADGRHRRVPDCYAPKQAVRGFWPTVPIPAASQILAVTNQLLENEWREPAAIRARQLKSLRALVAHAGRYSPFHAERFRAAGLTPDDLGSLDDLRRFPEMARRDARDGFDRIRCTALPRGTEFGSTKETSGSTGIPVRVIYTNTRAMMWAAITLRGMVWSGMKPSDRTAAIRPIDINEAPKAHQPGGLAMPHWGGAIGQCFASAPAWAMNIQMSVPEQAAMVEKARPHCLVTYPSIVDELVIYMEEHGITLPDLRLVQTLSEVLTEATVRRVQDKWGVPILDVYGTIETGTVATTCPGGHGYHVHDEGVVVEVLNEDGRPCAPGERGRVLVTDLTNYGFPMIRYDIGDEATMGEPGACPCGRGLTRLKSVDGRTWGRLVAADGTRLCSTFISGGLVQIPALHQYRIVQKEPGRAEVFFVAAPDFGPEDERWMHGMLQERVEGLITVKLTRVDHIERMPNGKHEFVICQAE